MINPEPAVSSGSNVADWIVTAVLTLWGFLLSRISAPDWVTALTVALLLVKIAHEVFRFIQSWRRAALKRRASDEVDLE